MKNRTLKPWRVKVRAMWKLLFSQNYALINFERTGKDRGHVDGFFSKGFTTVQINRLMDCAQDAHEKNIAADNYESVVKEAIQIINS